MCARPSDRSQRDKSASRRRAMMTWVRRAHMYLGLLLFPWVIFFGFTGMLFNHPGIGESVVARPIPSALLRAKGIEPVDARRIAEDVIAALRAQGRSYRLDPSFDSRLFGSTAFATQGDGKKYLFLVDLPAHRGLLLSRPDRTPPDAPFAGHVELPEHGIVRLEPNADAVLGELGLGDLPPARAAIAPSVRFRMVDDEGHAWNTTYDLGSGRLDGRLAARTPKLSLHDLLGRMHKTHHFPTSIGPRTFWALFADLTGITLVVWATTGLCMWVQIKKTRAMGTVAVSVGALIALVVMVALDGELRFENVRPSDPGDRPLSAARQASE